MQRAALRLKTVVMLVFLVGTIAADVLGEAVVGAVLAAEGAYGLVGAREIL